MIFVTGGCFQGKQRVGASKLSGAAIPGGRWGSLQYGSNQKCRCTGSFSFAGAPLDAGRQKYRRMRRKRFCQIIRIL